MIQQILDKIPFYEKVKLFSMIAVGFLAVVAFIYRTNEFSEVAFNNQRAVAELRMEMVTLTQETVANRMNIEEVSRSLQKTGLLLDGLIEKMNIHERVDDVRDGRVNERLKRNAEEIERLRDSHGPDRNGG